MELELLSLVRMARRLGITARWLRAEADAGRVPCLCADARYLFAAAAVERVLAGRAAGVRPDADPSAADKPGRIDTAPTCAAGGTGVISAEASTGKTTR
jgi:hypothetical protein